SNQREGAVMVGMELLQRETKVQLDPITLEMLWSRLISIVEESESTLVRTSFSPIVGEADDHSAALLDAKGNLLAQTPSAMPAFIGILDHTARVLLQHYPVETLRPGDVLTTNDPWICCGHLNDLNVLRPIFYKDRVVAFAANTAHLTDIGGRNSAESFDLFEEGLRILPTKLVKGGVPNEEIFKMLHANSRVPDQIIGDINAQLAAAETADNRLTEMLEEYGFDDLDSLSDEIITRTEAAMRAAIAKLPDGEYFGEVTADPIKDSGPILIKAKVTIHGDSLTIDFDGTSPQVQYGVNCPMNLTYAEAVWPIRVALGSDIPTTAGSLRPIKVIAPEGCILNPKFPAAVYARTTIVHNAHAPIFQALSTLVPEFVSPSRVQANSGAIWGWRVRGTWSERQRPDFLSGEQFVSSYLGNGGQGATGAGDGRYCMSYPDNCSNMPIEVIETRSPVIFVSKEITTDAGGPGHYRGGAGQTMQLEMRSERPMHFISGSGDKMIQPPAPLFDGEPGRTGALAINGTPIPKQIWHEVKFGDIVTVRSPGGGGYGDPFTRDPESVLADVIFGDVSIDGARSDYGVALTSEMTIDLEQTHALRSVS
ncbi:MAG: hydantoinase B/oxoprolinase family protein, partial [Thermomicrobiales bacterium]